MQRSGYGGNGSFPTIADLSPYVTLTTAWGGASSMHFHLPKPLHGWREFAGEVGIIVLGVLIALSADAAVEDWQWRHKVELVRKSLMGELGNDRGRWEVDLATSRCAMGDLDRLDRWAQGS